MRLHLQRGQQLLDDETDILAAGAVAVAPLDHLGAQLLGLDLATLDPDHRVDRALQQDFDVALRHGFWIGDLGIAQ